MLLLDTYSNMSFVSCSYTFLRIYSQRALSLFRRDWTYCRGLVCTGHVAGESTYLWGGKETKVFDGYFLCNAKAMITMMILFLFIFLINNWIVALNFATLKQKSIFCTTAVHNLIGSKFRVIQLQSSMDTQSGFIQVRKSLIRSSNWKICIIFFLGPSVL